MVRDILIWPSPVLKQKSYFCHLLPKIPLFQDLKDTVLANEGLGLSAIQIGVPLRVMVSNFGEEGPMIWVNPRIVSHSDRKVIAEEGCLSLPGIFEKVSRYEAVSIEAINEENKAVVRNCSGYFARLFQHEIDHFEGLVYPDRMDPGARDRIRRKLRRAA